MTVAIIGLVGTTLGALTALLGATLTEKRQARREEARWRRDQRTAAFDGALRHLLRAANRRSEFKDGSGAAILKQEHQREWFDDLVEAQFWLHQGIRYCDASQALALEGAADLLDTHIARLTASESYDQKGFSILQVLQQCIATVTAQSRPGGPRTRPLRPQATVSEGVSQIAMSSSDAQTLQAREIQRNIYMAGNDQINMASDRVMTAEEQARPESTP